MAFTRTHLDSINLQCQHPHHSLYSCLYTTEGTTYLYCSRTFSARSFESTREERKLVKGKVEANRWLVRPDNFTSL